jgi:DNA-binding MarR family transcriptional regulator
MSDSTRLSACNCFAARQAARRITRLYERHLSEAGLTSAQFSILVLLDEHTGATMAELARLLAMDRTTLLRALKPLQREHLVETRPSDTDARQIALSLSAAGLRKLRDAARLWRTAQAEFESRVGSEHAARLRRDLLALSVSD